MTCGDDFPSGTGMGERGAVAGGQVYQSDVAAATLDECADRRLTEVSNDEVFQSPTRRRSSTMAGRRRRRAYLMTRILVMRCSAVIGDAAGIGGDSDILS
jgi:hypothetical protein